MQQADHSCTTGKSTLSSFHSHQDPPLTRIDMQPLPPSATTPLQSAPLLPVNHAVALNPWFSKKILEQGFGLLQNNEVRFFSFQRRYAGLVTDENIRAIIQMTEEKDKRLFVFRDGECSQCVGRQGGTRCKHVAALALLCLREHEDNLLPLAELFPTSSWAIISGYLHDRAAITAVNLQIKPLTDHYLLHGRDDTGLDLQVFLSSETTWELLSLFSIDRPEGLTLHTDNVMTSAMENLQKDLSRLAATPNEQVLNSHGSKSKQQHLDRSLWMHLARLLFLHLPQEVLKISQDEEGVYQITFPTNDHNLFQLILPRLHTWELLDKLSMLEAPLIPVRAGQFSKVFFSPDGHDIIIEHWCRLPTDEEYRLKDLSAHRYGTRYLLDNHLFSLESIPAEERLTNQEKKGQLSLFAATPAPDSGARNGFTIKGEAISDFVADNQFQLRCKRHLIAEEILDLKIVNMPTELIIDKYAEDQDWCYLAGWYNLGNHKIRLTELLAAADDGKSLLHGPTTLQLDKSILSWFHQLGVERIEEGGQGERIKLRRSEFLTLAAQIGKIKSTTPAKPATLPAFLLNSDPAEAVPTERIATHLRPYQCHGTNWLYQLQRYRLGGILADDMGLGKTHQALALIDLLAEDDAKFLLVCPAAVLYHWPEKQEKFFPNLSMTVHHGSQRSLKDALASQVVVTTYGLLRRDEEQLADISFRLIIFDEMHFLKNRNTATFEAASQLLADSIIGLTGTPVENKIGELATLLSICLPELFRFEQIRQQFKQGDSPKQRRRLQRLVAPFILRRTRAQVLEDLPECSEDIRLCNLSPDQVTAYRQAVDQAKGMMDSLEDGESLSDFSHILTTIIRLKQICNHLCQLEKSTYWKLYESGKWDEFTRLLHQCLDGGLKVVVFSQFTSMLDIIEAWLTEEKIDFAGLRGSVAAKERSKRIKRFNTVKKCRVCCASLLAGGTGIDLTGAQVVIHYDRWWNPAKEEQATARVHRMGQRHPVQVYKLVTVGTLEEKIHHLIEKKRALAADLVVEDDGSVLKTLSRRELAGLFQYSG